MTRKTMAVSKPVTPAEAKPPRPEGVAIKTDAAGRHTVTLANSNDRNPFKIFGASDAHDFNAVLVREALSSMWVQDKDPEAVNTAIGAAMAALRGFKPADEIEAMLAAQATAMHFGAMECFRRSMLPNQPADMSSKLRKDGANLSRGMVDMLDALDRKRGKGPQVVRVERVVVHEGGRAIVGHIQPPAPKVGEG